MQPKTKEQKRIVDLSTKLKPLTDKQREWGINLYQTECFTDKKGNICAYCGNSMDKSLKCPVCGKVHKSVADNNRMRSTHTTFNLSTCVDQWQVVRTFEVINTYRRGYKRNAEVWEVCQSWVDSNGKETRLARGRSIFGGTFLWGTPLELKKAYNNYYGGDIHEYYQRTYTYPYSGTLLPILKRNGLKTFTQLNKAYASPVECIYEILKNNKAETMLKMGYGHLIGRSGVFTTYWDSLKIVMRHNYKINDWTMWRDTINLLSYFHMDKRNPQYVCAEDLKGLHDRLVERKRIQRQRAEERQRRIEQERNIERARRNVQAKENYTTDKGMYFGICIVDKDMTIEVLKSVEEFAQEGNTMHHCVYTNAYYAMKDSLILSARINGESIETIEVDLNKFTIVQSRGKHNENTEHHQRIIDLVNGNMNRIKAIRDKAKAIA